MVTLTNEGATKMQLVTETVQGTSFVEYDINIHTNEDDEYINLVFYPLRYSGDPGYDAELMFNSTSDIGLPLADYSKPYALRIPKKARGPKYREAYAYLEEVVTYGSFGDVWDEDGMDWTSIENVLDDTSTLINEFRAKLPRRGQLKANS
jgi:hypothetical protein